MPRNFRVLSILLVLGSPFSLGGFLAGPVWSGPIPAHLGPDRPVFDPSIFGIRPDQGPDRTGSLGLGLDCYTV